MLAYFNKVSPKTIYLNFLFSLLPVSFIAGNLVLNLNVLLLIISATILYGTSIFKINFHFLDKIILLFFSLVLFTGLINNFETYFLNDEKSKDFVIILKTIMFLRYLILYFVIRYMVEQDLIDFKLFFISSSLFSILVSLDIFYQYIFGKDIFGNLPFGRKYSGPFGDEYIAGSYLQRFSLFSFFLFPIFFKIKKKTTLSLIIPILFIIFLSAIIISGNRMPLILFLFIIFLIVLLEKKTRKYIILFSGVTAVIIIFFYNFNTYINYNFKDFVGKISKFSVILKSKEIERNIMVAKGEMPDHFREFETFYDTWLMNKYLGGGVKSFRINCPKRQNIGLWERSTCNTHPHNYYLEILTDLGLIGFFILSFIYLIILYNSFIKKYSTNSHLRYNHIITPFMFIFLAEIFPIKSTGSFFTTGNATFIFLIMSITIALSKKRYLN